MESRGLAAVVIVKVRVKGDTGVKWSVKTKHSCILRERRGTVGCYKG